MARDDGASAAEAAGLPIEEMDVEVFERRTMRILTTLKRLSNEYALYTDECGIGKRRAFDPSTATAVQRMKLWRLTTRMTRRIEKLRALHGVLGLKAASIERRIAALEKERYEAGMRGGAALRTVLKRQSRLNVAKIQGEQYLLEALQERVSTTVAVHEELETRIMQTLCSSRN